MGQTPITVNDIIVNAFNLIGEISPNEPIGGDQMSRGLSLLNDLIASFSTAGVYIPFITDITWLLTPGQGSYKVSDKLQLQKTSCILSIARTAGMCLRHSRRSQ